MVSPVIQSSSPVPLRCRTHQRSHKDQHTAVAALLPAHTFDTIFIILPSVKAVQNLHALSPPLAGLYTLDDTTIDITGALHWSQGWKGYLINLGLLFVGAQVKYWDNTTGMGVCVCVGGDQPGNPFVSHEGHSYCV